MYGGGSRRIQGKGSIQRPVDFDFINATPLPADKTIQSVRYYARRREQMKTNGDGASRVGGAPLQQQLDGVIKSRRGADLVHGNQIRQVKVEPIIIDSNSGGFDTLKYPLTEEERVQVLEQRYFSTQGYYHYIYQCELKKEMNRFVNETEAKVMEVFQGGRSDGSNMAKQTSQHYIDDRSDKQGIIEQNKNGFYPNSKVGKSKATGNFSIHELVPVHTEYRGMTYQQDLAFTVNENKRMELSRRA